MKTLMRIGMCRLVCGLSLLFLSGCLFPQPPSPTVTPMLVEQPSPAPPTAVSTPPPTPLPPQPTAVTPTTSPPTPTYDPVLADWTVMVYLNADNNLEAAGLLDLNEMEMAGSSDQVQVVVQVDRAVGETAADGDWTDTRRYLIQLDESETIVSPPLSLGERNMGDPQELADFISWGMRTYPANRYALILWDHGAGWNGIAFDEDTAEFGQPDHISLPDLRSALDQALAQSNAQKLDVIGFDACLMGQLDVFAGVAPYADFVVGSEELTPGLGWDYATLLGHLHDAPGMDGAALAQQMVTDFMTFYTETAADDFVTMSAVQSSRIPQVVMAVEQLGYQLAASPAAAAAVGDARSGAASFARAYAESYEQVAAVDLAHFAKIVAQRSADAQVVAAAEGVKTAVSQAVIAHQAGSGIKNSHGVAIYFPRNRTYVDNSYVQTTTLPAWHQFLTAFHDAGAVALPPPEVRITNLLRDEVGVQNPAYIAFELVGRDMDQVAVFGGGYVDDGRRRLLEYDRLIPEPAILADGTQLNTWRDGVHEDFYVWRTQVTYLFDQYDNGDFVVMWPTEYDSPLFSVQGRFRRAAADAYVDVNLLFDNGSGRQVGMWGYQADGASGVAELTPLPDDRFQIYSLYVDENDQIVRELGPELIFDETGTLRFDRRPLPDGRYFFGFVAENVAGATSRTAVDLTINNEAFVPDYVAYLDAYLGFQFLYPESWFVPKYDQGLLYTTSRNADIELQITLYPNVDTAVDAAILKTQTLQQFGPVDLLFEDEILIAGVPGLRTAYGYDDLSEGSHTGVFFTFVRDGTGYVVDVDGVQSLEPEVVTAVEQLIRSWQFVPAGVGLQPGQWAKVDLETFTVAQPANFVFQTVNGWQRFSSGLHTFVALRTQPAETSPAAALQQLVQNAGSGVANFSEEAPTNMSLGGFVWQRVNINYRANDGTPIEGMILVRQEGEQLVVAWAEAPALAFDALETAVFLTMIADLDVKAP